MSDEGRQIININEDENEHILQFALNQNEANYQKLKKDIAQKTEDLFFLRLRVNRLEKYVCMTTFTLFCICAMIVALLFV